MQSDPVNSIRLIKGGRKLLPYEDERDSFHCPDKFKKQSDERTLVGTPIPSKVNTPKAPLSPSNTISPEQTPPAELPSPSFLEEARQKEEKEQHHELPRVPSADLVDWYDDADDENPRNWSFARKAIVSALICLLTFSVYSAFFALA